MTISEAAAASLQQSLGMVNMTLADFSDADLLVRPCPGANHTAWQLGHLTVSEVHLGAMMKPDAVAKLPDSWEKIFSKETSSKDDAAFFPKKAELLAELAKVRAATVALVKSLTPAELEMATGERMRDFAPTWTALSMMLTQHTMMHVGQFQVIRRKLGKPILF